MSKILDDLDEKYFEWLCERINAKKSYTKLLEYLHGVPFRWSIPNDENRAADGLELRWQFQYETKCPVVLGGPECTVLEMMVALAIQCEVSIGMDDPEFGNRTDKWFWDMIKSLGLKTMTNSNFSESIVADKIDAFLERDYAPNGEGGLFTIEDCRKDLRDVEIWYQACWYFDQFI